MASNLTDIAIETIDGRSLRFGDFAGQVVLVVNTASKCGFTPQFIGLEAIYQRYRDQGFVVLGFPTNDFADQEPGSNAEIAAFCESMFGIDFPMFAKVVAVGPDRHPLYSALIEARPDARGLPGEDFRSTLAHYGIRATEAPEVLWNFEKFLIGRDGMVIDRFTPETAPDGPILSLAIEQAL